MNLRALGFARIALGAIFLVRTTPLFALLPGAFATHGGPLYGWPRGELRAAVFGLVLPPAAVIALVFVRTIAALLFMVGVRARAAGIAASLAAYLVYAQEPFALIFTLHVLYLSTLLFACTDAVSVVALRPSPLRAPESSVTLIRALLVSIYLWSAFAKLRGSWLDGSTLSLLYREGYATGPLARMALASHARAAAVGTVAVEMALPLLLVVRRTRTLGILLACSFHAVLEITMHPDVFGWVMVTLLAAFWPEAHLPIAKRQRSPEQELAPSAEQS